jgi:hypothetical protein
MTPADIIAEVRTLVQDSRTPYRYTDTVLLRFLNQTVKRMAMLRPDLFLVVRDVATTPGDVTQVLPADAIRLVEVYNVKGGNVVTEVNKDTLDQTYPGWRSAPSGQPVNYIRHVRNPTMFFLYPAPASGVTVVAEYAATPVDYTMSDTILAPSNAYLPSLVDGVVYLAQSIDDEHISSGRAKLFSDAFTQGLGVSLQSQQVTDTDAGGLNPKQVV